MKKKNIFLAIICAVAIPSYLLLYNILNDSSGSLTPLEFISVISVAIAICSCIVVENPDILLWIILVTNVLSSYKNPEVISTFFSLFITIWFLKTLKVKKQVLSLIIYIFAALSSIAIGIYLIINIYNLEIIINQKVVFIINIILCSILMILHFAKIRSRGTEKKRINIPKKELKHNKMKNNKKSEDFFIAFIPLELSLMIVSISIFCVPHYSIIDNILKPIFIFLRILWILYELATIQNIRGKESNLSKMLIQFFEG